MCTNCQVRRWKERGALDSHDQAQRSDDNLAAFISNSKQFNFLFEKSPFPPQIFCCQIIDVLFEIILAMCYD